MYKLGLIKRKAVFNEALLLNCPIEIYWNCVGLDIKNLAYVDTGMGTSLSHIKSAICTVRSVHLMSSFLNTCSQTVLDPIQCLFFIMTVLFYVMFLNTSDEWSHLPPVVYCAEHLLESWQLGNWRMYSSNFAQAFLSQSTKTKYLCIFHLWTIITLMLITHFFLWTRHRTNLLLKTIE